MLSLEDFCSLFKYFVGTLTSWTMKGYGITKIRIKMTNWILALSITTSIIVKQESK